MKNFEEIRNILTHLTCIFFCYVKTRLDGFISNPEISISGYKIVRLDRIKMVVEYNLYYGHRTI